MINPTPKQITRMEQSLSSELKMKVSNLSYYHNGFSFTVPTELDAYKAAYKYQPTGNRIQRVKVEEAVNINEWSVSIYTVEE